MFAFFTPSAPDRVWRALTEETSIREYLYGLALSSEWTANAPISVTVPDSPGLIGEVLCVQPGRRLSYLISAPDAPAVYLTWHIRTCEGGSICSLQIDEADASTPAELEDIWLPVLDALQRLLATP